jgi:hypothetical protein
LIFPCQAGAEVYRARRAGVQTTLTMHIHPIFHVSVLEPYKSSHIPNPIPPPPPPIEIDHNVEYEVEEILDSRLLHRRLEYFIYWKGYGISERTWEPSSNC